MQHATFRHESATVTATATQQHSVKALALAVLARNSQCNASATVPEKERNFRGSKTGQKLHSVAPPQLHDIAVPTALEADPTARVVQEKLLAGVPVRMRMGDIGEAIWTATDTQRDELVATLTATGDNTPVYCWGELVRISNWSRDDKLFTYQAKQSLHVTIAEPNTEESL